MSLPAPTLQTPRVRLRPFGDTDVDDIYALQSDAHALRYWDSPPWNDRARAESFIGACRQMEQDGTGVRLAVDHLPDGAFIGWCTLNRWNPDYRSASLGYCFEPSTWGRGYATEAARALLGWAFETLDLNRVQAEADTRNVASARVLEKLGFVREGTLREDCVVDGEVSDSWVYGLIRREWQPAPERPLPVPPDSVVLRDDDERLGSLVEDGWTVAARSWAARLDVTPGHAPRWAEVLAGLPPTHTCRELRAADVRAALELDAATATDYPGGVATAHEPLTVARATPTSGRRGFGVLDDGANLVAMTFADVDDEKAEVDFTVVARHRRGQGLARAVKAASLLALTGDGVTVVRTGGSDENRRILAANVDLGFHVDEHWLTLTRAGRDAPGPRSSGSGTGSGTASEAVS